MLHAALSSVLAATPTQQAVDAAQTAAQAADPAGSLLFSGDAIWFTVPALVGTLFFVIRIVMALLGIDFGSDEGGTFGNAGDVGDAGLEEGVDHAESTSVFKFVSIQTLTAFAMGFGWGGLVARHVMNLGFAESSLVGAFFGLAYAWFVVWVFKLVYSLESSGNLGARDAVGKQGQIVSIVPGDGSTRGRVRVIIGETQRTFFAVSTGEDLHIGARVRITAVNEDNSVTVVKLA